MVFETFTRLCGVHDALGAKLAEQAGFEALWLSSLELHTAARLPDMDILGISEYTAAVDKICDRVGIPVVVDGDCGGGSPINTIRMVREFEKNGACGICLEDNQYPKRNSLVGGVRRVLANPKAHAMKIRAACDARRGDFVVIARVESFIAGLGLVDALERAQIYTDAGADAILIHSKADTPNEVMRFADRFFNRPVVVVPTTYGKVRERELWAHGVRGVVYANAGIRAAMKAQRQVFGRIAKDGMLARVEGDMAPLSDIWDVVAMDDFRENEARYAV